MPTVQKAVKPNSTEEDELHDKLMESFLHPASSVGLRLIALSKTINFFSKGSQQRKVVNVDCVDTKTGTKIRVVCFDDRSNYKIVESMIPHRLHLLSDFYRPTEGKIIIQDQTVVEPLEVEAVKAEPSFDSALQEGKLSLLKLYAERLQHKGPESIVTCCKVCRSCFLCDCNSGKTLELRNTQVVLTDHKALQIKASITFDHLEILTNLRKTAIMDKLSKSRDLDHLQIEKDSEFAVLLWNECFRGRAFTIVSTIDFARNQPPTKHPRK